VTMREKLGRREELRREYELGSGQVRRGAQQQRAKASSRERLDLVIDGDLFVEMDRFVTGRALASMPGGFSRTLASWVESPCRSTSWPRKPTTKSTCSK